MTSIFPSVSKVLAELYVVDHCWVRYSFRNEYE
ncbi:hypothetical protein [Metabacillus arenae]